MRPRFVSMTAVVMVLAWAGVLAGAGHAQSGPEAPPTSSAGAGFPRVDQPGVTSNEIRVGGVASKTNPLGGPYGDGFAGAKAYFEMINAQGGIYGRRLELTAARDDQVGNDRQEVQALVSEDNVFAVLPVEVLLFTGADLLARQGIPTFGWNINAEWGSEKAPGAPNLFGEKGSYLCFTCASPVVPWLAHKLHKQKIGLLAYQNPSSSSCAQGVQASFRKYASAKVVFVDSSLAFGVTDFSNDVAQMIDKGVDLVTTCMNENAVVTLAREMRKQGLNAIQYLPNAYNEKLLQADGPFFEGSYVLTFFTPFEVKPRPKGLALYLRWIRKTGGAENENSLAGWINADLFYQGLRAAGPTFTRQKVVDEINKMTDYTAGGIVGGINWQVQHTGNNPLGCQVFSKIHDSKFVPAFGDPGKPFVCFPPQPAKLPSRPATK